MIPDYEVPDTINGFSFNKEETDDGYQLTFTANEAMRKCCNQDQRAGCRFEN